MEPKTVGGHTLTEDGWVTTPDLDEVPPEPKPKTASKPAPKEGKDEG